MNNLELKAEVLNDGTFDDYRSWRSLSFQDIYCKSDDDTLNFQTHSEAMLLAQTLSDVPADKLKECVNLYNNNRARAQRLRRKIEKWSKVGFVYFMTLTFRDEVFENTSEETRRRYVARYLKGLGCMYCANEDFGSNYGREHYHAVVCFQNRVMGAYKEHKGNVLYYSPIVSSWEEKFGFGYVQGPVVVSSDTQKHSDKLKVAKYVAKCANHSLKATTKHHTLVYSRGACPWSPIRDLEDYKDGFIKLSDSDLERLPFDVDSN